MQSTPRVAVGCKYRIDQFPWFKFVPNGGFVEVEGVMAPASFAQPFSDFCGMCGSLKCDPAGLWCLICWHALLKPCDKCGAKKDDIFMVRVPESKRYCVDCAANMPECVCCSRKDIEFDTGAQHLWAISTVKGAPPIVDLCRRHLYNPDCYRCKREINTPHELCHFYAVGVPDMRLRQRRMYKIFCADCFALGGGFFK